MIIYFTINLQVVKLLSLLYLREWTVNFNTTKLLLFLGVTVKMETPKDSTNEKSPLKFMQGVKKIKRKTHEKEDATLF